jgi:hypothetical protein
MSRTLAAVFSIWLAVSMVEPVQLHTCPMHGGLAIETGHVAGDHSHHDRSGDRKSHQCSCLGDCNSGSAPVGLTEVRVSLLAPVPNAASRSEFGYRSPALVAPHFLLPFSNGPPAGSSRA